MNKSKEANEPNLNPNFLQYGNPLYNNGKLRNKTCRCGSSKKIKKCCGRDRIISLNKFYEIKANFSAPKVED